ncbi:hypothetical protein [Solicola sp. PLA-1-18]|uniref:hypothetical protein n=1 Tax=Solicola sp. PLA-1-18 TaxID=3380532 RepID=UPI003B7A33F1
MASDDGTDGAGDHDPVISELLAALEHDSFVNQYCGMVDPRDGGQVVVGWRGDVPPSLRVFLSERGLAERVGLADGKHLCRDMFGAGVNTINRMARARINVVGFDFEQNLDGIVVEYYSHGPQEDARARNIAAAVAARRGVPVRAIPTSELEGRGAGTQ